MAKKKSAATSTSIPVNTHKHVADKRPNIPTRETAAFAPENAGSDEEGLILGVKPVGGSKILSVIQRRLRARLPRDEEALPAATRI
jgi:hypothetical protein